jgi:hypothetical protein
MPEPTHIPADLAPVVRHPNVMPAKHDNRDGESSGVEDFLAGTRKRIRE